jgi:hypothetical protein
MARILWLWLALCVSGACASAPPTAGTLIEHPSARALHIVATDTARQIGLSWPPAHTELSFAHATDDAFGRELVTALRGLGFAVAEHGTRGSQLVLAYVVDDVAALYRVLVRVRTRQGRFTLARMYSHGGGDKARAAGAWTQQVAP